MESVEFILRDIKHEFDEQEISHEDIFTTNAVTNLKDRLITKKKIVLSVTNHFQWVKNRIEQDLKTVKVLPYDYFDLDEIRKDLKILGEHFNISIDAEELVKNIDQKKQMTIMVTIYSIQTFE